MKLYTKQKPFSQRFSAKRMPVASSNNAALTLDCLNRTSVFETFRVYGGQIFRAQEHMLRLSQSCAALAKDLPVPKQKLIEWLENSIQESKTPDATLRLSVHWQTEGEGQLVLFIREFQSHPEAWYENGVALRTAVGRRPTLQAQDPQIKASQYVCGVLAFLDYTGTAQPAASSDVHELLFLGSLGTLAEGTVSNIFIVKENSLLTPSMGSGILKGVTRGFVLELAQKRFRNVVERPLTRHEVYTAEECFITNTSSEVLPVVRVDERRIGSGRPGPATKVLAKDFKKEVMA